MKPLDNEKSFEAGIFCGKEEYLGHVVNFFALLWLYDYAFLTREMLTAHAHVRSENSRALRINLFLGFVPQSECGDGVVVLKLDRSVYAEKAAVIRRQNL